MGSCSAGGVVVTSPPASMGGLTTAVGRLIEPDLFALSSHGGHHLFINRIPPRLPKEDVEKIILAQLRLHPFVLQVSKCSVIPQNSLKNKGYGFITLDGSPSPSDLDAIADSLNNKLQVGCRTLGVRVCTDCHTYGEDDGCASSSHCSTPPNEPDSHMHATLDGQPSLHRSEAPTPGDAEPLALSPDSSHAPATAPANSPPVPPSDILQTAVAALAKQGSSAAPAPGPRRRKTARLHDPRPLIDQGRYTQQEHQPQVPNHPPQQQQQIQQRQLQQVQGHGDTEGSRWRAGRGNLGHNGAAHPAGRHRRHMVGVSACAMAASEDLALHAPSAAVQVPEAAAIDPGQNHEMPCEAVLNLPVLSEPPLPPQHKRNPGVQQQEQEQPAKISAVLHGGDCSVSAVMAGSPRSVSSYSSASGSGPGSASNSAPGSVSGSGSGFSSAPRFAGVPGGTGAGICCSRDSCAEVRTTASPAPIPARAPPSVIRTCSPNAAIKPAATAATCAGAASGVGACRQAFASPEQLQRPHQQPQQRRIIEIQQPVGPPSAEQQRLAPCPMPPQQQLAGQHLSAGPQPSQSSQARHAHVQPQQTPAKPHGPAVKASRVPTRGSRATSATAVSMPVGLQAVAVRGQSVMMSLPMEAWAPAHASGPGPAGQHARLHSASAPTSSARYLHQYHQQHQERHCDMPRRRQQQLLQAHGGAFGHVSICSNYGVGSFGGGGGAGGGGVQIPLASSATARPSRTPAQTAEQGLVAPEQGRQQTGCLDHVWPNRTENGAVEGLWFGFDRRVSYPGGAAAGAPRLETLSQPAVVQYQQQQQQQQPTQPQGLHSMPFTSNRTSGQGVQLQQPQLAARAFSQMTQQQAIGFEFMPPAPPLQPPGQQPQPQQPQQQHQKDGALALPNHPQQYVRQQAQFRDDMLPTDVSLQHRSPLQAQLPQPPMPRHMQPPSVQQPQSQQQQQGFVHPDLQQHLQPALSQQAFPQNPPAPVSLAQSNMVDQGFAQGQLSQVLSSERLSSATPSAAAPLLPLQLHLIGSSAEPQPGFLLGSSAPNLAPMPPDLSGWRTGSLDLEFGLRCARAGGEESLVPGTLAAAASGSTAVGALSVRSAELLLGRSSSDGVQDAGAESPDSTDLDPLDLEPMILQLLENEDDDAGGSGGGNGSGGAGGGATLPAAEQYDIRHGQPEGDRQQPISNQRQHLQQQHHRYRAGHAQHRRQWQAATFGAGHRGGNPPPVAQSAVPPARYPHHVAFGSTGSGPDSHQQQLLRQGQQQPQRPGKQDGFGGGAGINVSWALPRPGSDGSSCGSSTGGAASATATGRRPVSAAACSPSFSPTAALQHYISSAGDLAAGVPAPKGATLLSAPAGGDALVRDRPSAVSTPAATPAASWTNARDACTSPQGAGLVGSFPGVTGYTGPAITAGALQGGAGRGSRPGPGGSCGGLGGRGPGGRGGRHFGGRAPAGYGGGRSSASRGVAVGTGGGGGGGGVIGFVTGVNWNSGSGAGGFEPQGFVSGSLPNASLLAVMQRLDT